MDSVSYAIGIQMGENLKQNGLDSTLNVDLVARGIYEVLNNKKALFGGDTLTGVIMKHFNPQAYTMMQENETKSKKFFEENAKNQVLKQLQAVCNTKLFLKEQVLNQHFLM
jgi:FKBP-type peptidyl-prolyl cis-trans isomerase